MWVCGDSSTDAPASAQHCPLIDECPSRRVIASGVNANTRLPRPNRVATRPAGAGVPNDAQLEPNRRLATRDGFSAVGRWRGGGVTL